MVMNITLSNWPSWALKVVRGPGTALIALGGLMLALLGMMTRRAHSSKRGRRWSRAGILLNVVVFLMYLVASFVAVVLGLASLY